MNQERSIGNRMLLTHELFRELCLMTKAELENNVCGRGKVAYPDVIFSSIF